MAAWRPAALLGLALLGAQAAACGADVDEPAASEADELTGDRADPAGARGDRIAATSTVWGRRIALHLSDADDGAWASIDDGSPNDEAWLDRSFDGGATWEGRLGKTRIPKGRRGWRTMMYRIDDLARRAVGAVRACGKAGDRVEIACTPWFRTTTNAGTRLDAAATALMQLYDPGKGLFRSIGWWNSANALTALIDWSRATGSTAYRYAVADAFAKNDGDDFTNEYMDDTGWWGLAWVRAYDLTGERRYLDMARKDADYIWTFEDGVCGGGIWWRSDKKYKNAITSELFIKLAAQLHDRIPGDTTYLARAEKVWAWFFASGMINGDRLVNDGLNDQCKNNGGETWTYNQGVILGALVELHAATGRAGLLDTARALADASTSSARLNPGGILREPCESNADVCGGDGPTFKGVYARNLGELDRILPGRPYRAYLAAQANAAHAKSRTTLDQYGVHWAGPFDRADASRQASALDLLTAARP